MDLRVGDWVQVRSKHEILATLDSSGRLEDSLHATNVQILWSVLQGLRSRTRHATLSTRRTSACWQIIWIFAVTVGLREAAKQHVIFWKDAWLKPADGLDVAGSAPASQSVQQLRARLLGATFYKQPRLRDDEETYRYKAVRLLATNHFLGGGSTNMSPLCLGNAGAARY
jgi:hypothetical protein